VQRRHKNLPLLRVALFKGSLSSTSDCRREERAAPGPADVLRTGGTQQLEATGGRLLSRSVSTGLLRLRGRPVAAPILFDGGSDLLLAASAPLGPPTGTAAPPGVRGPLPGVQRYASALECSNNGTKVQTWSRVALQARLREAREGIRGLSSLMSAPLGRYG
jgi:hypothetical protein